MTPRKPRKTVSAASPNPSLVPSRDTLRVGDETATSPPAAAPVPPREKKRKPFGSHLPPDLQHRFKVACVIKGVEMQDALEEAIEAWLARGRESWTTTPRSEAQ